MLLVTNNFYKIIISYTYPQNFWREAETISAKLH